MGSKISKAMRPHVKAAASIATTPSHHVTNDDTNERLRQDSVLRLPVLDILSHDDINVATSNPPTSELRQRSMSLSAPSNVEDRQLLLNSFEQFMAEHRLRSIEYEGGTALPETPRPHLLPPPSEPVPQCLICCKDLPVKENATHAKEAIKPCRSCDSLYCTACIKNMFIDACKDTSRMPPRCCVPLNLHQAKPYLNAEEISLFRSKYEEWSTSNPVYCPVPVCSAFIPDRLLPQHVKTKTRQRVDSGVGTPTSDAFACPTCEIKICAACRQPAHPGSMCSIHEFGLDAETAALLKSWGYKKCPKCGHGLKRMFGCNHMECRCGAHFCWVCMQDMDECGGECSDDDEEFYDSDPELDEDIQETTIVVTGRNGTPVVQDQTAETVLSEVATQAPAESTETTMLTQPAPRPRNLDGGGSHYWANADFDFGEEPSNDYQDRSWSCTHSFEPYTITFAAALSSHSTEMECVKCWCIVHPSIEAPKAASNQKEKVVSASAGRARAFGVRGGRGRGRGRYAPPRGLFRADATIGTAPHLTTTILPLSQSLPATQILPMDDVQFTEQVVDTYGNIITTSPIHRARRASLGEPSDAVFQCGEQAPTLSKISSVFTTTPTTFSFAHECINCHFVVCEKCKTDAVAIQEEVEQRERERRERQEDVQEERQEMVQEVQLELPENEGGNDSDPEPSYFD